MNKKHFSLIAIFTLFAVSMATAQEDNRDVLKSYSYIEAQGGLQMPVNNMLKLISPTAALSYGYMTPKAGVRLHINGWQSKLANDYKFKYIDLNADLLMNVTRFFSHDIARPLNLYLLGGFGHVSTFDNEYEMASLSDKFSYNIRAGLRLENNITKPLGVSLEVNANYMPMISDNNLNNSKGWGITAMLGVCYRFSKRFQKPAPILTPVVQDVIEDVSANMAPAAFAIEEKKPEAKPESKPEPKVVVKKETLHEEIFYTICKSDPTEDGQGQMKKVAQFMEKYKDAKILVVGYADRGTGNPQINLKYAGLRAADCKDALVKLYGCNPANILTDSKGDTVQPFDENDKNRCVIIESEAQYTVRE